MSCMQLYDVALPVEALLGVKENCIRESNEYHVDALITLPLSKSYQLWTKEKRPRQANTSAALSWTQGIA